MDWVVFEEFLYRTLSAMRRDSRYRHRQLVLLADNARIHKDPRVLDLCKRMRVVLLFNAQYSPFLNPVEHLFEYVKRQLRHKRGKLTKWEVAAEVQKLLAAINSEHRVESLWLRPLRAWRETLDRGYFRVE